MPISPPNRWLQTLVRVAGLVFLLALLAPAVVQAVPADWNDAQIRWLPYQQAQSEAKKQHKPICLVFYADWCPHCHNYSRVFHDAKVVAMAKKFAMVRVDVDREKELSSRYTPDGGYVPRTFFVSSSGELNTSIHAPRPNYVYFYDESEPASLLQGMEEALRAQHK